MHGTCAVYKVKIVGPFDLNLVGPIPEQIKKTPARIFMKTCFKMWCII